MPRAVRRQDVYPTRLLNRLHAHFDNHRGVVATTPWRRRPGSPASPPPSAVGDAAANLHGSFSSPMASAVAFRYSSEGSLGGRNARTESPSGVGMDSGLFPENTRLGRYQIVKRLGGGESSEVLLAISQGPHGFERIVVLKRLLPRHDSDESMGRMLATEAVAYARLTHPAIVRLYDFFELEGRAVLVVEYVDGPSLAELQATLRGRREALSDPASMYIASRVFGALAAAHAARDPRSGEFAPVIHRDVSPGSVLLPWDGFVKLGDFGFAKVKGLTSDTGETRHGMLKGTLGYMAPEQALGEPVTPRTDVYAGCLLLRELLLAAPAFPPGMPELEFLRAMAETELRPIEALRGGVSPMLAEAMRRGLARDPEERTLTAAEMGRVLRQETDLAIAQMSLVDALARVRPSEARASTPPAGTRAFSDTPASGTMRFERMHLPPEAMPSDSGLTNPADTDSHPTLRYETPGSVIMLGPSDRPTVLSGPPLFEAPRRGRGLVVATALAAAVVCVALVVLFRGPTVHSSERVTSAPKLGAVSAASVAPSSPSPPPPAPPPSPPPPAAEASPPPPPPASTVGDLVTPAEARSHRVFIDGRYAAPRAGATLSLPCGLHTVRIGSKGRDQKLNVPCGGSISAAAR
jgi:serine/threonine protein kinase